MSLGVEGACSPDIAWLKLPAAVVWRGSAHGVHHRRHAALGRLCHLLFGLLRWLPYLLWLLRGFADHSRQHKEQNRNGQPSAEKNELAPADPFHFLYVSSCCKGSRRFRLPIQDG